MKKSILGGLIGTLLMGVTFVHASPCDEASIEIYNQTAIPLTLINQEGQGDTDIRPIHPGFVLDAHSHQTVTVRSGVGTRGDANGLLVFLDETAKQNGAPHKFVAIDFKFKNKYWVQCEKNARIVNTAANHLQVHQLPGYQGNVKVFIVD